MAKTRPLKKRHIPIHNTSFLLLLLSLLKLNGDRARALSLARLGPSEGAGDLSYFFLKKWFNDLLGGIVELKYIS